VQGVSCNDRQKETRRKELAWDLTGSHFAGAVIGVRRTTATAKYSVLGKILDSGWQKLTRKIRAKQRPSKQRQESDLVPNEEISKRTQQKIQGRAAPTARKINEKIRARKRNHQNKIWLDLESSRDGTHPLEHRPRQAHRRAHIQQLKNQKRKMNTQKKELRTAENKMQSRFFIEITRDTYNYRGHRYPSFIFFETKIYYWLTPI
jgi:hypothetical protein